VFSLIFLSILKYLLAKPGQQERSQVVLCKISRLDSGSELLRTRVLSVEKKNSNRMEKIGFSPLSRINIQQDSQPLHPLFIMQSTKTLALVLPNINTQE